MTTHANSATSEVTPAEVWRLIEPHLTRFTGTELVIVTPEKLRTFLQETKAIGATPARRLRALAIGLEQESFQDGWRGLATICEAAASIDQKDVLIFQSWGIAAIAWMQEWMTPDLSSRQAIAREAERALQTAIKLSPKDSATAHALGMLFYSHPSRKLAREDYRTRAIEWFERAVEWDSTNVMAQLYLAHCHHDRKDYVRAISEYEEVNLAELARNWPRWRRIKCIEQLAHCYACSGETAEAIRRFTALLDEIESLDDASLQENVVNLNEMNDAVVNHLHDDSLRQRTAKLLKRIEEYLVGPSPPRPPCSTNHLK